MAYLADIETLRHLTVDPVDFYVYLPAAGSSGTETLQTELLDPGFTYHIQNITAWNDGTNVTSVKIGFISGATFHVLKKRRAENPYETVEYVGEVTLREGSRVAAVFLNCAENDKLHLWASGFRRRI